MIRRPFLSLFVILSLASTALAAPSTPEAVGRELASGRASPAEAATAWNQAGITPEQALKLVTTLRVDAGPTGARTVDLQDPNGRTTELMIHVPKEPRADGRYGVLLCLHGLGGQAAQLWPFGEKVVPPGTILVAPSAQKLPKDMKNEDIPDLDLITRRFPHWWSYQDGNFPLKALQYVKQHYPIDTDRVGMIGYSMGGFGTWNLGLRYHDRFSAIAPMAGGLSRMEYLIPREERSRHLLDNATMQPSFFIHGDADNIVPVRCSRTIAEDLKKLGAEFHYTEVPGGRHVLMPFLSGNETTKKLVDFLANTVREPNPRSVTHSVVGTYHGSAYWVRIDAINDEWGTVRAEVKSSNSIEVTTEKVDRLTLFLDPDLIDTRGSVRVTVDGQIVHEGVVEASLEAVAESFAATQDPQLTYAHKLVIDLTGAPAAAGATPAVDASPWEPPVSADGKKWF